MTIKVTMPQLGESVVEGTVGRWHVRVGDRVEKDQAVVEILTDKADSEVPSPVGGVVTAVLVEEGAVVRVGQALVEIDETATAAVPPAPKPVVSAPTAMSPTLTLSVSTSAMRLAMRSVTRAARSAAPL